MEALSEIVRQQLDLVAQAMADGKRYLNLSQRSLQPVNSQNHKELVAAYLAGKVEYLTRNRVEGQLTIRAASRELLYGYISGGGYDLVICPMGTSSGLVSDREPVIQAWAFTDSRMYPADFDRMPDDALDGLPIR